MKELKQFLLVWFWIIIGFLLVTSDTQVESLLVYSGLISLLVYGSYRMGYEKGAGEGYTRGYGKGAETEKSGIFRKLKYSKKKS